MLKYWKAYKDLAYNYYGNSGDLKKNPLSIERALKSAWKNDLKSDLFAKVVENIVGFAKKGNS